MGREIFLSVFSQVERKKNKQWSPDILFSDSPKSFLFKIKRKLNEKKQRCLIDKNAHAQSQSFFFFSLFVFCAGHVASFLFFIFLGCGYDSGFVFVFVCLTRHDFDFLINWMVASSFLVACYFFVLIKHHFLTRCMSKFI